MSNKETYQIKLPQFEGPFDLLLFFIERDELDIYNIPIAKIINDFLSYIHCPKALNIELSSEFILFISTLLRIKAQMLLPRKQTDAQENETDPRQELIDKIVEYKRFKEAAAQMAEMEALRMLMVKRGNLQKELTSAGEVAAEGTEMQNISLFKLMKSFEKVMENAHKRKNKPVHTVAVFQYSMDQSRQFIYELIGKEKTVSFERIFEQGKDKLQLIFLFLTMLELIQLQFISIIVGEATNSFVIKYNENSQENYKQFENLSFQPLLN